MDRELTELLYRIYGVHRQQNGVLFTAEGSTQGHNTAASNYITAIQASLEQHGEASRDGDAILISGGPGPGVRHATAPHSSE